MIEFSNSFPSNFEDVYDFLECSDLVFILEFINDFGRSGFDDELDFFFEWIADLLFGFTLFCCFIFYGEFLFSDVASLLFTFDRMELNV